MNFAQLLFPDFSLILIGYLLCRFTALNRSVWSSIDSLVYYFLFPVLLFQAIVKSPLELGATSSLIGAALCLAAGGIALSYSLPHWPWLGKRFDLRLHAASSQVAFRFNSFIALALASKVAGPQGLQLIAVIIGVTVPLLNVAAVWPMARHAEKHFAGELLRNPLIIGTASGLVANLLGLSIPPWLDPTVTRIGQAALALNPDHAQALADAGFDAAGIAEAIAERAAALILDVLDGRQTEPAKVMIQPELMIRRSSR